MKLYQAMLAGARNTYQAFGTWSDGDGGTCAMGAVMVGLGHSLDSHDWYQGLKATQETFPELNELAACPQCRTVDTNWMRPATLMDIIMHLNDKHAWSRQRIAEWLSGSRISEPTKVKEGATL